MPVSHMDARTGKYRYLESDLCRGMPFFVQMAGFDLCQPQYRLDRRNSPISVIGLTLSGSGTVCQNGQRVRALPGSLFIVTAGDSHEYFPDDGWEFCWLNVYGRHWRELMSQYGLLGEILFPQFAFGDEFVALVRRITEDEIAPDDWQPEIQTFLFRTLLHLYRTRHCAAPQTLAEQIRSEFARCAGSGLTQEDICRRIGVTPRHAQRVFRQAYGTSIHRFLLEEKLRKARALLLYTDSSVTQIAAESGFENEKYFSTVFHRQEGMTPSQYRRMHGGTASPQSSSSTESASV